ncbi:MAG: maleate cis-trans isomerase [Candidatus Aminicenantes bacterium]|nr:maleate cis-trans isomerase [Candidatus Aminicenantes bacterium]
MRNNVRFGLIVPSSNTTMEAEFWRMISGWATVHTARMRLEKITVNELEEMEEQMLEAVIRIADAEVNIIGYGCTSGSLLKGKDHGGEIERKITEKTGIPAVATAKAVIEALNKLQIKKLCVATPYIEEINELEKSFLEQNKIDVLNIKGLGIAQNREVGSKNPNVACELAKEVYKQEAQGIFISCTNFKTIEVIDKLEKELGVPVVSSNTATLWAMMKKASTKRKLRKYGRLLLQ